MTIVSGTRLLIMVLAVLLFTLLSAPRIFPVYGLDDSTVIVTVDGEKFHVEIDLIIQLSIDDYSQFEDAEDAYSRDTGTFRGKLRSSIENAIRELVKDATISNLNVRTVDCDEGAGKMHVELNFDIEGAITTTANEGKEYNLRWRSLKADQKVTADNRLVDPSEALGLDFTEFDVDLDETDEWTIGEGEVDTSIRKKLEYELDTDEGEVDLRVTQKFAIPGTGLWIGEDSVRVESSQGADESAQPQPPMIPGFPWEGVVIALALGATITVLDRRQSREPKSVLV